MLTHTWCQVPRPPFPATCPGRRFLPRATTSLGHPCPQPSKCRSTSPCGLWRALQPHPALPAPTPTAPPTPAPEIVLSTKSPSYSSPSGNVMRPRPCILPSANWPSYTAPLLNTARPRPCQRPLVGDTSPSYRSTETCGGHVSPQVTRMAAAGVDQGVCNGPRLVAAALGDMLLCMSRHVPAPAVPPTSLHAALAATRLLAGTCTCGLLTGCSSGSIPPGCVATPPRLASQTGG